MTEKRHVDQTRWAHTHVARGRAGAESRAAHKAWTRNPGSVLNYSHRMNRRRNARLNRDTVVSKVLNEGLETGDALAGLVVYKGTSLEVTVTDKELHIELSVDVPAVRVTVATPAGRRSFVRPPCLSPWCTPPWARQEGKGSVRARSGGLGDGPGPGSPTPHAAKLKTHGGLFILDR
ncbi:hypothetical protein EYF80_046463 [Liparis tanakae]|uniref:Uncharacterized protein n=1 Tax=Liparis tanakae TaxID=230148 RepID=A0A4Z2FQ38_9TELE|nr:hypothetical protein EYF80_046463 [Liparis tanakae]